MAIKKWLSQHPVFAHLKEGERKELADIAIHKRYRKDEWITHNGDIWPYLFLVASGEVSALKFSNEGRRLIVNTLTAGELLWGMAFFEEGAPMPVGFHANEDSKLFLWPRDRLLPFLLRNGRFSWELNRLVVNRVQHASEIVEELAFHPVTGRLARLLLNHFGDAVQDYVERDLTLDEMAARIGTTREMVCRQLYRLADKGAIRINRTAFMITQREVLEKMAGKEKG